MNCPKCGAENPDDVQSCYSCGCDLTSRSTHAQRLIAETSRFAAASLALGILSFLILLIFMFIPAKPGALTTLLSLTLFMAPILAIISGIIGVVKTGKSRGQLKGKGLAIAGIVLGTTSLAIVILSLVRAVIVLRPFVMDVRQKAQLGSLDLALVAFRNDYGDYPPSGAQDEMGQNYCGAQKLGEALFGKDLMGFHSSSRFRRDGTDDSGKRLYIPSTMNARRGPYLELGSSNIYRLKDVFEDVGPFDGNSLVICDVYSKKRHSGKKTGMPILYYRANISSKTMDASEPMEKRIYNAKDNLRLICLGRTRNGGTHPLADDDGEFFYDKGYKTIDPKITAIAWPHRPDSFILISAGKDGLYGTQDDITNSGE